MIVFPSLSHLSFARYFEQKKNHEAKNEGMRPLLRWRLEVTAHPLPEGQPLPGAPPPTRAPPPVKGATAQDAGVDRDLDHHSPLPCEHELVASPPYTVPDHDTSPKAAAGGPLMRVVR